MSNSDPGAEPPAQLLWAEIESQPSPQPAPQQQPARRRSTFSQQMEARRAEIREARAAEESPVSVMESLSPPRHLAIGDEPRVFVYRDLVERLGPNQGLLLSQIVYWFRDAKDDQLPRARAIKDGKRWLQKSAKELAAETGLSVWTAQRALKSLVERGLIQQRGRRLTIGSAIDTGGAGVTVYANAVKITGDAAAAIVLSQICYWSDTDPRGRCRLRVSRDGEFWAAKTHEELAAETGLTVRRVRSAVDRLAEARLIVKGHFRFGGRHTLHLRLAVEEFADAWVAAATS